MLSETVPVAPGISSKGLALFRELLLSRSGLAFGDSRSRSLVRGLADRMARLRFATAEGYYAFVTFHRDGEAEWERLLEALLNKESSFFRHPPSFHALARHVLPDLVGRRAAAGRSALSVWSAGCSTGQEAYSLAITVLSAVDARRTELSVLGTDLSGAALEVARAGRYRLRGTEEIPLYGRRHLTPAPGAGSFVEVSAAVRGVVSFRTLNLLAGTPFAVPEMDVVFCQNVLIHLGEAERLRVVRGLVDRLSPGGCLFLAPGELLGFRAPEVETLRLPDTLILRRSDGAAHEKEPSVCR